MGLPFITGYVIGKQSAARLASASSIPSSSESRVLNVDDRVDRLVLVVEAMWELLEASGFSEEQLVAKIAELDAADGVSDGKVTRTPVVCAACGSASPAGRDTCQVCGESLGEADPFGKV
jgi:hypothetical protein